MPIIDQLTKDRLTKILSDEISQIKFHKIDSVNIIIEVNCNEIVNKMCEVIENEK